VTLTFVAAGGAKRVYPNVPVGASGSFATSIEIPAGATLGAGKITISSPQDEVHINRPFTVT